MFVAFSDDTKPPTFGNSCPDTFSVVISDCMDLAAIQFDIPNATDDSGIPINVKSMVICFVNGDRRLRYETK